MGSDHQMLWLEDDADDDIVPAQAPEQGRAAEVLVQQLESELQATKRELTEVRKELAAKTVQLSRKDQSAVQEKAAEIVATVTTEKDRQLQHLAGQITQLELNLSQKEEEVDELRRLYGAQKKALRQALETAAEREALEREAEDASKMVAAQAVEDELDKLMHELALLKARSQLELSAKESEVQYLRQELAQAAQTRKEMVAETEAVLTEAWQAEVNRVQLELEAQLGELQAECTRLRTQMQESQRISEKTSLSSELAALNNQKVQVQREFEVFKEVAAQTSRQNREDLARLLDENAALRSRLASKTIESAMASTSASTKSLDSLLQTAPPEGGSVFESYREYVPQIFADFERRRKGLMPFIIVGSLLFFILLVAVIRAAVSSRGDHRGLCFLAKLGVRIGAGCGNTDAVVKAQAQLNQMLENAPRVKDVTSEGTRLDNNMGRHLLLDVWDWE